MGIIKASTLKLFVGLIVGGIFVLSHSTVRAETQLSGNEFAAMLSGNTIVGDTTDGAFFKVFYATDGSMRGYSEKGDWSGTDEGTWEGEEDRVCFQWSKWRSGKRYCRKAAVEGSNLYFYFLNGDLNSTAKVEKGNSHDL